MKDQELQTLTHGIESLASLKNLHLDFYCVILLLKLTYSVF